MCSLKEIEKRKIVEHNDLITSVAKMDKVPLKIFELAVSCIDTENLPKDNIIYLSKAELFTFFDVSDNGKHTRFKEAIEKMQKQAFFEIKEVKGKGYNVKNIVPIPYVEWNSYNDMVTLQFQPQIMPYLIDLKKNFTQYALSDVMELNSKYSIILYKWLSMNYNQYEHYSVKGGRRTEQVESYRNPSIKVSELRILTDTMNEYKNFTDFNRRVLKEPIEEINENTSFNVTYDKIKKGRSIDSIVFHITKKHRADDNSYKLEDKTYQEAKAQKEESEKDLVFKAMESQYTKLLIENFLLSPYEMTDTALMAGLQKMFIQSMTNSKHYEDLRGSKSISHTFVRSKNLIQKGTLQSILKRQLNNTYQL